MHGVGVLDEPRRYAVGGESAGVGTGVVAERIATGGEYQRGWETGQALCSERHRSGRKFSRREVLLAGPTGRDAQEDSVEEPERFCVLAAIERRVAEHLPIGEWRSRIPRNQAGAGRGLAPALCPPIAMRPSPCTSPA